MPTELKNRLYFSVNEVLSDTGVSRQTLWRWRQDAKVPLGHRFRDGQILFDEDEFEAIRNFANQIEPLEGGGRQLKLFRATTATEIEDSASSESKGEK